MERFSTLTAEIADEHTVEKEKIEEMEMVMLQAIRRKQGLKELTSEAEKRRKRTKKKVVEPEQAARAEKIKKLRLTFDED